MIIFIDESGDPGFKTKSGSSESFVIALVIFDHESDAEATDNIIQTFKKRLNPHIRSEIKFNKLEKSQRIEFLISIRNCKFRIRAMIIKKEAIKRSSLKAKTTLYYQYFLKQLLEHNHKDIKDAKLRLDSLGERKFKKAMSAYLRKNLNDNNKQVGVMKDLQFVNSKNNSLIQLADMIAGSIRRSYQNKNDSETYKQIIQEKIEEEWIFDESSI